MILWLVWIPASGAFFPGAWYPSAAVAAGLLAVSAAAYRRVLPPTRVARVALLSFAALVGFNYLSMLWAGSPQDALTAANELLLYLAVAWTISLVPWTPRSLAWFLGLWAVGVALICAVELLHTLGATQLGPYFYDARYANPLDYPNATAALAALALWPSLLLASRREVPNLARVPLLAVSVFLAGFAFLPQSRGALVGLAVTVPVVLIFAGQRIALLIRMLVVGAGLAVTIPRTVDVYTALSDGHRVRPVLQRAADGILLTCLVALVIGAVLAVAERRLHHPRMPGWRVPRLGRRRVVTVALVAVIAAGFALASPVSHLVSTVYSNGRSDASVGSVRLLSAAPEERLDYARVAVKLFAGAPILGVGSGNFGRRYDALRSFAKHSQYTHDLPLRVLSETGIVGTILFLLLVGAILVGLWKASVELPGLGRACAVAALGVACYFIVHASLEWLDEYPALAVPALALPLAAIGMRRGMPVADAALATGPGGTQPTDRLAVHRRRLPERPPAGVLAALALLTSLLITLALVVPYMETRYEQQAFATFRQHPSQAYHDLSEAASLNPVSANALTDEGTIAEDLYDGTRARLAFSQALQREDTWYPHLELALLYSETRQFGLALSQARRAAALDRDDPLVTAATSLILRHQSIDPVAFNGGFTQGAEADVFRRQSIR